MEIWKDIKNYEGLYQISTYGRVKSFHNNDKGKILSIKNSKGWYLSANLSKNGKYKSHRIHILVAEHFIESVAGKTQVNHKDGDRQNNNVSNLEWVTPAENMRHAVNISPDFLKPMIKRNRFENPKKIRQYDMEGNYIAEYANSRIAAKFSGVCGRNILQVANKTEYKPGKVRKQAGGYIWKIAE